jgi:DNA-binding NarL/FixJ family response regulator
MTLSLLIVDDSELIRSSLKSLLEHISGVGSLLTACTLARGLQTVDTHHPHLTILDLNLPDGNAICMIQPMKRLAPEMQVAVLTNDASEFNRKKCLEAGASWFFDKSTEFEKLLDVVKHQAQLN